MCGELVLLRLRPVACRKIEIKLWIRSRAADKRHHRGARSQRLDRLKKYQAPTLLMGKWRSMALRQYSRSRAWCARQLRKQPSLPLADDEALQLGKDACVLTVVMLLLCSPCWALAACGCRSQREGRKARGEELCDDATARAACLQSLCAASDEIW